MSVALGMIVQKIRHSTSLLHNILAQLSIIANQTAQLNSFGCRQRPRPLKSTLLRSTEQHRALS